MTRVIFQIGLLAFCVAAVVFGLELQDILEVVARAFIVFIAVIGAMMVILLVGASFHRQAPQEAAPHAAHSRTAAEPVK
jgi:hypothetical protein